VFLKERYIFKACGSTVLRVMREMGVMMRAKMEEGEKYKQCKLVILV
jgi:hypothetical protein